MLSDRGESIIISSSSSTTTTSIINTKFIISSFSIVSADKLRICEHGRCCICCSRDRGARSESGVQKLLFVSC